MSVGLMQSKRLAINARTVTYLYPQRFEEWTSTVFSRLSNHEKHQPAVSENPSVKVASARQLAQ